MKDDEIIKALERCVNRGNKNYNTDFVLDLINRQQSEIDKSKKTIEEVNGLNKALKIKLKELNIELKAMRGAANSYKAEVERLKSMNQEKLDTIHDLQAEIERLTAENERQKAKIKRLTAENKILSINADTAFQDGLNEAQDLYAEEVKDEVRAEAVREFAERLKEKVDNDVYTSEGHYFMFINAIDDLAKEWSENNDR